MPPDVDRRIGVEDQFRAWETIAQGQHQPFDLYPFEIHENAFGQEQEWAQPRCRHRIQPGIVEN